jgi:hypothetical protein
MKKWNQVFPQDSHLLPRIKFSQLDPSLRGMINHHVSLDDEQLLFRTLHNGAQFYDLILTRLDQTYKNSSGDVFKASQERILTVYPDERVAVIMKTELITRNGKVFHSKCTPIKLRW